MLVVSWQNFKYQKYSTGKKFLEHHKVFFHSLNVSFSLKCQKNIFKNRLEVLFGIFFTHLQPFWSKKGFLKYGLIKNDVQIKWEWFSSPPPHCNKMLKKMASNIVTKFYGCIKIPFFFNFPKFKSNKIQYGGQKNLIREFIYKKIFYKIKTLVILFILQQIYTPPLNCKKWEKMTSNIYSIQLWLIWH